MTLILNVIYLLLIHFSMDKKRCLKEKINLLITNPHQNLYEDITGNKNHEDLFLVYPYHLQF